MSLMRKRVIAIIAASLAIVILGFSLAAVLEYVDTIVFVDPADNVTKYYARKDDGVYKLYAKKGKTPLETTTLNNKTYYVTALGTLVLLDSETGAADDYFPVETEGNEQVGFNDRVLIFPHAEKKDILSLEVHNEHGTFTFQRVNEELELDPKGNFIIKGSPLTSYNQELFAELYVGAGYALTTMKIKDPILRTADGALCPHPVQYDEETGKRIDCGCVFSEYGLVAETRVRDVVDENGKVIVDKETEAALTEEYEYEPAYYILTNTSGEKFKLIIGDMLVTGGGYYAQYVGYDEYGNEEARSAVYVIDTASGKCLTSPIEDYVSPTLCYPLPLNRYYDVEDFVIGNRKVDEYNGQKVEDIYNKVISFSYIELEDRENTMAAASPYKFELDLAGYGASDTAINNCLYNFYSPTLTRTVKFAPSPEDLELYGFWVKELDENGNVVKNENGDIQYQIFSKHFISYNFEVIDDNGKVTQTITQNILISDKDFAKTGNYYVYTSETVTVKNSKGEDVETFYSYDFITEADGHMFEFLLWDEYDWVNPAYVDQNIAFVDSIKITSPTYNAFFDVDNSASDQSGSISSALLKVTASQNGGESRETFNKYEALDKNGYYWVITASGIKVYNYTTGKEAEIKKDIAYYDYNDIGAQVLCRTGYIECTDKKIEVTKNYITIYHNNGTKEEILRYDTDLWRKFYQTLLYAYLEGGYPLEAEEEKAIIEASDGLLLTLEINMKDAESAGGTESHYVYKFYKIPGSSRKAYIMVSQDGGKTFNGGFYVYRNKVEKFITDSQKFFANQNIEPDAKR